MWMKMWVASNVGKGEWEQNKDENEGDKDRDKVREVL